ncbi:MAG TPA: SGNH/GDSL hydrolase family protein [Burkholderiaceae bacterium]
MTVNWSRRGFLAAACASTGVLAACGSSSIESALSPSRFIVFGDGFSDVGQTGSRYTVNDGSVNIWVQQLATNYGKTVTAASAGGTGYARGNARVAITPDAAGNAATLTVTAQLDNFLATDSFGSDDLGVVSAGIGDIVAQMAAVTAGSQTADAMLANAAQAGTALGAQVRRMVQAGAKHVLVAGVYELSRSPWGIAIGQTSLLSQASGKFNDAFKIAVVDLGETVFYVDTAYYFNLLVAYPSNYSLSNSTAAVCTSVDAGNGIGTGAGQVNSALCNTSTLVAGADYTQYVFADGIYPTPAAHRLFGNYAYDQLRYRW